MFSKCVCVCVEPLSHSRLTRLVATLEEHTHFSRSGDQLCADFSGLWGHFWLLTDGVLLLNQKNSYKVCVYVCMCACMYVCVCVLPRPQRMSPNVKRRFVVQLMFQPIIHEQSI